MLLVLAILAAVFWLSRPWGIAAVGAAGVVELAEIAFWIWLSRRRRPVAGAEALPGASGVAVTALDPLGQVRLAGELWRARCPDGAGPGESVVVERLEPDLTLVVRPERAQG